MSDKPEPALVSAMTTEHFVMQSAISTATSEAGARASIYMYSLSGALVALGICAQSGTALVTFVASVMPAIILLGLFTVVRLVDISLDHLKASASIAQIHSWYATLGPIAAQQFSKQAAPRAIDRDIPALRFGPVVAGFTTIASMIATINFIVTGGTLALLLIKALHVSSLVSIIVGAFMMAGPMAAFFAYQSFRLRETEKHSLR